MENIIQNPGLHHIIEDTLIFLDKGNIASFRLLNQDGKNIVDNPMFYLKKLSQVEETPKNLISKWKKIIQKLYDYDKETTQKLALELFKMYCKKHPQSPLELVYNYGSKEKISPNLAIAILENSDPESFVNSTVNLRPIHLTAMLGYAESFEKMFKKSPTTTNSNAPDNTGRTPMYLAAGFGHIEIVKLLLNLTNNPNAPRDNGKTPIYFAAGKGYLEILKLLMNSTENPHIPDKEGVTPINIAAHEGQLEVVKFLLNSTTANPNIPDNNGETPLNAAAGNGHIEIVKLLMNSTENPNSSDNFGRTPIYEASKQGYFEIVKSLMKSTENPNAPMNNGVTPIFVATQNNHIEILKLLINSTENPNAPDNYGRTPLNTAKFFGYTEIVKLFEEFESNF